jgi:hypothetical protein
MTSFEVAQSAVSSKVHVSSFAWSNEYVTDKSGSGEESISCKTKLCSSTPEIGYSLSLFERLRDSVALDNQGKIRPGYYRETKRYPNRAVGLMRWYH